MVYHKPVLLKESVEGLNIQPEGVYVDLTFGGGGHSREVLKKLGKKGRLIAFDQDPDAKANAPEDYRFKLIEANFRFLRNFLRHEGINTVQGILADLGISSHQIDQTERGFSFRFPAVLDMRMNPGAEFTAEELLMQYSKEELQRIFRDYGELRNSARIASLIVEARKDKPVTGVQWLEQILRPVIPAQNPSKFLAKVYQSIRIEVNKELEALREVLPQTLNYLGRGGRLVVITYHSVEDRVVKNFLKSGNLSGEVEKDFYGNVRVPWKLINRSVITPSEEEVRINKRARSAKLRIAERQ
ncbi:MAG: 16S rRNA (cytosine(1402)-N(4))-methyltransferase RsmH [Bacteroidales bacterium]|nr:16S rRNA (cytosine(1402)-N(4))-methyltransferase RsmH [Bacteroidales bacterium]MBN2699713.1 16S rRNA (cytosine(1402)-N(4))-methyltransferase RsmH [Bacteroidales bacterium]